MKYAIALSIALSLAGCASLDVTQLGPYPEFQSSNGVQVFSNRGAVNRKFREIAIISADDQGWGHADSKLTQKMVERARQIGADGLVLTDRESVSSGGAVIGNAWVSGSDKVMRAVAIVFE